MQHSWHKSRKSWQLTLPNTSRPLDSWLSKTDRRLQSIIIIIIISNISFPFFRHLCFSNSLWKNKRVLVTSLFLIYFFSLFLSFLITNFPFSPRVICQFIYVQVEENWGGGVERMYIPYRRSTLHFLLLLWRFLAFRCSFLIHYPFSNFHSDTVVLWTIRCSSLL